MNKPQLQVNGVTITLPHHQGFQVRQIREESRSTTIGGAILTDAIYFKYAVDIAYEAIHKDDYEILRDALEDAIQGNYDVYFRYEKIPEYISFTKVVVDVSNITFRGGSGTTDFYYSFNITMVDKSAR